MNYGYQPQYGYSGYNGYNPYSNQYNYQGLQPQLQVQPVQQTQPQQSQPIQQGGLSGWYVDSYDVTKSINADMTGTAMFFPSTDGKEIYKKQLDINTGKSSTLIYKLESTVEQTPNIDFSQIYESINDVKKDLSVQISEIKDMVMDNLTSPPSTSTARKTTTGGAKQ